jgi:transglutaminase/protease-like cytokinesis protein 3
MKKVVFATIFILILATSLVKNSTKEIEDKILMINENISSLKSELGDVLLEYNYLSSPDKLTQYQTQYFIKDLIKINIMKIKEITEKNNLIKISDLVKRRSYDER